MYHMPGFCAVNAGNRTESLPLNAESPVKK